MPTTILKFGKVGEEDISFGTGTFEVDLSNGKKATLHQLNLSSFLSGEAIDEAIYYTDGSQIGQSSALTFDATNIEMNIGDGGSLMVGSSSSPGNTLHVAVDGEAGLRIDNSGGSAADAVLEFALHGTVDWNIRADDSDSDNLKISAGTGLAATPHITLMRDNNQVGIGTSTASTTMVTGIVIDQATDSTNIMEIRGTGDIAHGVTDLVDTSTYGFLRKAVGGAGGFAFGGVTSSTIGCVISGVGTNEDATTADTSRACIELRASTKSGSSSAAIGATGNALAVMGSNTIAVLLVKGDGDVHNSGGNTAMGTYDAYDDVQLLQTVKGAMDKSYRDTLGEWVNGHTELLERRGVISRGNGSTWFISQRGWRGLLIDAIRQLSGRIDALEQARGA